MRFGVLVLMVAALSSRTSVGAVIIQIKPSAVGVLSRFYLRAKDIAGRIFLGKPLPKSGTLWEVRRQDDGSLVAEKKTSSVNIEHYIPDTLNYLSSTTDLYILKDGSELLHPDYILPLAVTANLSLTRTWSSRAGELFLRRKYAPRWEAFMKPLISFVNVFSEAEEGMHHEKKRDFRTFLSGNCSDFPYEKEWDPIRNGIQNASAGNYLFQGADRGLRGEWTWRDARHLGRWQLMCGLAKSGSKQQILSDSSAFDSSVATIFAKLSDKGPSAFNQHLAAAALTKMRNIGDFLTILSKNLPPGWKFGIRKVQVGPHFDAMKRAAEGLPTSST